MYKYRLVKYFNDMVTRLLTTKMVMSYQKC